MIPSAFEYEKPSSLEDALHLLRLHGEGAKLLAGGHSLIPMMKLRLAQPGFLIDLGGLDELRGIAVHDGHLTIGALTTHAEIAASDQLRRRAGALWDAANVLGDPQVRNRGTIGGACAHGDPGADYPAVLLALNASFTLAGPKGMRKIEATDFFIGIFETALRADEILIEVSFGTQPHSAYEKLPHPASHFALVGAAASVVTGEGRIKSARLALSGVGDVATRASGVEAALFGVNPHDAAAVKAACRGVAGAAARSDVAASSDYRTAMAEVFAARAVGAAASR